MFFKSLKKDLLLVNIIYIVIGYLLITKGSTSVELVITILAYGLFLAGLIEVIRYFATRIDERFKRNDFIIGIALMAVAIVILICKYSLSDITTVALGVAIVVSAAFKIQDALDAKKIGAHVFGTYMALMFICLVFGALVIINFFYILDYRWMYLVAGIGMLFCGVTDLISNFYLAGIKTKFEKIKQNATIEKPDPSANTPKPEPVAQDEPKQEEPTIEAKFTPIDVDTKDDENKETPDIEKPLE